MKNTLSVNNMDCILFPKKLGFCIKKIKFIVNKRGEMTKEVEAITRYSVFTVKIIQRSGRIIAS